MLLLDHPLILYLFDIHNLIIYGANYAYCLMKPELALAVNEYMLLMPNDIGRVYLPLIYPEAGKGKADVYQPALVLTQ